jgi:hypothetical protein
MPLAFAFLSASNALAYAESSLTRQEGSASDMAVRNKPGATTVTRMPVPCSSAPSTMLRLASAAFDPEYRPIPLLPPVTRTTVILES